MKPPSVVVAVAALAVLTAGCTFESTSTSASQESAERPSAGQAAAPGEPLGWGTCANELAAMAQVECASMQVPLDHDDPGGEQITMQVGRKLSAGTEEERIGSLVLNPGGPGVSGIEFLAGAATMFPSELTDRFDLVAFDPRGVAESTPIECRTDEEIEAGLEQDVDPDTPEGLQQLVEDQADLLEGCAASETGLLTHMSTADVANDMDLLREALGDAQLTYMGFSYGTSIGATYATMFPSNTRALVLDGSVSPSSTREEQLMVQVRGFEEVYGSFVQACNAEPECAIGPDANARIQAVRQQLKADPLTVETPSGERTLTAEMFDVGLATALYDTAVWAPLASAVATIDQGGALTVLTLVDQQTGRQPDGTFSNASDSRSAVNCADSTERLEVDEAAAAARRVAATAPLFGDALAWGMLSCLDWPQASNPTPSPTGEGAPPVLVIGTVGDPATPYEWSEQMAASLESGVLLTYEGDGHTAFSRGGACIQDAVVSFLVDLTVPQAGTRCAAQDGGGFVSLSETMVQQFTSAGLPEAVARCIVDGLTEELGAAEFEALVLSNDLEQLKGLVTTHALSCATKG